MVHELKPYLGMSAHICMWKGAKVLRLCELMPCVFAELILRTFAAFHQGRVRSTRHFC